MYVACCTNCDEKFNANLCVFNRFVLQFININKISSYSGTMMRLRPKLGSERDSEWRCCFCLHVRTGTILIGTWHLILHLMALVFLAAIARDNRLIVDLERDSMPGADLSDLGRSTNEMPTPLSNIDLTPGSQSSTYSQHGYEDGQPRDHALLYLCTLAVTLMLVYGAARGKAGHLLPFFCLQIFDFAITVLTATGYLCYLRSIHRLVAETRRVPWRDELLQLPAPALALVVLSAFLVAVLLKGYCINVVWRCYKYCTWRTTIMSTLTPFVISSEGLSSSGPQHLPIHPPSPDYSSLLPDYEEAVKQLPPPSYRAATLMTTETEVSQKEKQGLPATQPPVTAPATSASAVTAPATTAPATTAPATPAPATTAPVASETMVVLPQLGNESQV